ncbi:hypothetical protein C6503_12630 [Candidatus Poribacteria bacterium]|nr:MAG: hypothetical protein C6503_12630 [Candidatus Poribacteria bacterium]
MFLLGKAAFGYRSIDKQSSKVRKHAVRVLTVAGSSSKTLHCQSMLRWHRKPKPHDPPKARAEGSPAKNPTALVVGVCQFWKKFGIIIIRSSRSVFIMWRRLKNE